MFFKKPKVSLEQFFSLMDEASGHIEWLRGQQDSELLRALSESGCDSEERKREALIELRDQTNLLHEVITSHSFRRVRAIPPMYMPDDVVGELQEHITHTEIEFIKQYIFTILCLRQELPQL